MSQLNIDEQVTAKEGELNEAQKSSYPYIPPQNQKIHWTASLFIVGSHIVALAGFFTFTWKALALCVIFHWMTGGLGITLGFHRLLTHRSFKTAKWVEYFLTLCGNLACQGGPITWVATHRLHHAYSDEEKDPHTPLVSFYWAHMGWTLVDNPLLGDKNMHLKLAPDLMADPVIRFLENTMILWTVLLAGIFYLLGGWPFVIWGIFVRVVLVYHTTWLVNSATHVWGYRTYRSNDKSTNLWWVALLSYGEGWHNNHHAFQFSARHGLRWWEFDTTYLMIKFLEFFGLAEAIKIPTEHLLATKKLGK